MAKRNSDTYKVASMLSAILDEPQDDAENPAPIRMEQARALLTNWSSAQSSLRGAFVEIINLKAGYCVRCKELPCPVCGRTE